MTNQIESTKALILAYDNESIVEPLSEEWITQLAAHLEANRPVDTAHAQLLKAASIKPREHMQCRYCGIYVSAQICHECTVRLGHMPTLALFLMDLQMAAEAAQGNDTIDTIIPPDSYHSSQDKAANAAADTEAH